MNDKYKQALNEYVQGDISLTKLCKKHNISRTHFTKFVKDNNVEVVNKQNIARMDETVFENIDSEEKAYWLGFMYADGYVIEKRNEVGIGLKQEDYEHLVKFKDFLKYEGEIRFKKNTNSYTLSFLNKKIKSDLIAKGCVPNKSKVLTYPSEEVVPKDLMIHFIRGYIDGDGYIGNAKHYPRLSILGTENMLKGIVKYLNIRETKIRKANPKGSDEVKEIEWKGLYLKEILKKLYCDSNIYLERKYKRSLELVNLPT